MKLSEELMTRGFVHQFSAPTLEEIVDKQPRTVYLGIDPTADSIHVGNFAGIMLLRHLVSHGYQAILLVGGGTGMVGDPKPDVERPLTDPAEVVERAARVQAQIQRLVGDDAVHMVNNHDWLNQLSLIDFLRETGKHFTVNELIKKEAIASRLASESGISYTEFAYPLLQAYDYLQLHNAYGCDLQIGGSDQWGNIVAGVDLVRKKTGKTVYALTLPLLVDATTGKKSGNLFFLSPLCCVMTVLRLIE
jgi:tyrosyl-tRNA synthetase